jgi:hypothetical protein
VFAFNPAGTARGASAAAKLAQDRTNRSKRAKVILRRITMFDSSAPVPASGDDPMIRLHIEKH